MKTGIVYQMKQRSWHPSSSPHPGSSPAADWCLKIKSANYPKAGWRRKEGKEEEEEEKEEEEEEEEEKEGEKKNRNYKRQERKRDISQAMVGN